MLELMLLLLVGIATGFLNVMAGGGSMLSVPVMIFLGVPGPVANATNRIAILPQNISATLAFYRKGFRNFRLSLSLAACTIPGALLGAWLATQIPDQDFNTLLAIIMMIVLVVMLFPQKPLNSPEHTFVPQRNRLLAGHVLMVAVGFWGGFIQIGVGFLLMPVLNRVIGFDLVTTNSHKVFIVLCYTVVALLVFASQLELLWKLGIALAIGTSIGGWLAANFQIKRGVGAVKWTLNIVIIAFIIKLLLM